MFLLSCLLKPPVACHLFDPFPDFSRGSMMLKEGFAFWWLVATVAAAVMSTSRVMSRRLNVGDNLGWTQDVQVNYTEWADNYHFYVGDWLYFRFDKQRYNVLEVNETNYGSCYDREFIKNITRGGRDVFQLTEARPYYFLSSGGYCYHGLKLAINVSLPVPPPLASAAKSSAAASPTKISRRVALLYAAIAAATQCIRL